MGTTCYLGLGKTITAIALDAEKRKSFDHQTVTLIIAPLAVLSSWQEHLAKWAPHLKVMVINNKNRRPFMEAMEMTFQNGYGYDVFVMHYPAVRLEPDVAKYPWFHVIADEVHALQDRKSQQTKAVKKIKAFYKTGLSGTPVFNKPDDLWSLLNWMYPKYWKSYWGYFKRYIKWVEWDGYRTVVGVNNEEELQALMAGFYIRRKKEEVLSDLPEKYYTTIKVKLHTQQARAYNQMKKEMLAWIGEHEDEALQAPVVIAQLIRLQQFASAYAEIEQYEVQVKDYDIDPLDIDRFREDGIKIYQERDGRFYTFVTETRTRLTLADPSSKLDVAMEIIQSTDEPIVVFSEFAQMINLLGARLEKAGISYGLYTGSQSRADRDRLVQDFQDGKVRVFAGTIGAGGVGITLTRSSTVIILNRNWAQALNQQAIDRLHRIGQKNAVHVIDIVAEGTIDEERNLGIELNWRIVKRLLGEEHEL